jgi:hypothetical protein
MQWKDMVDSFTISSIQDYDHVCKGCALGKSHWLPFLKFSTTKYEKMDLIIVNLTGPMSIKTWSGMSYILVIIEVSYHFPAGCLLQMKDKAAKILKKVIVMLERQSGKCLKHIRCDNGSEFITKVIDSFCWRNGIILETTVFFEMVWCMLHSAKMDLHYWGKAFLYTVYICSCMYTFALDNVVLLQALSSKKPDVLHFCIFGSIAYVNIPKKLRGGKFEVTSIKCHLLE